MSSEPRTHDEIPEPWSFIGLAYQVWKAAIFKTGAELQVWARVAAGQRTAEQIARPAHWDVTETRKLLDALCGMQFLRKEAGQYSLVPLAEHYLQPDRPSYIGDLVRSKAKHAELVVRHRFVAGRLAAQDPRFVCVLESGSTPKPVPL